MKASSKHSSMVHGAKNFKNFEQVRVNQMAAKKINTQKLQMKVQQQQYNSSMYKKNEVDQKLVSSAQRFKDLFAAQDSVSQDIFLKDSSVIEYISEQLQNE